MKQWVKFVFENSVFLVGGSLAGLVWANLGPASYEALRNLPIGVHPLAGQGVSLHFLVNDILMSLFFALAGKEVWSAMLPGGALRGWRRSAVPVMCAVGGMAGPACIYLAGAAMIGQAGEIGRGWAIPCATDIAFSYMIALLVFGKTHPAVPFLLLLAIADDALGLIVLAVFYPQKAMAPLWLLLVVAAVILGLVMRRRRVRSFWWYLLIPGGLSWTGMALAGVHPALGLLPIIPTLPHAKMGEDHLVWGMAAGHWALDKMEMRLQKPVQVFLGMFGLLNAGVHLTAVGSATYLVLIGLLLGKPIGIMLGGLFCRVVMRLPLPDGLSWRVMPVIGCTAGIGFTVALFVATVAFPPGDLQDAAKMGALASFLAAIPAIASAKLFGIKRRPNHHEAA